eukprot:CAMPEP_0206490094 /NCGR_PEP_ID=MMETSP0324_2-20121206/43772_1 /ASSEMBLY_ACC=CAM_ASM_000836 /TAXON_ID=2866 /ORGANISM="Crypthecodinium cohnii, Strain Seligo" /LENGTH=72 /DNA_ID=CAMNT_0053970181 /DNA_START=141 /DNA_END=356 /DNA_ORIENTATION=+
MNTEMKQGDVYMDKGKHWRRSSRDMCLNNKKRGWRHCADVTSSDKNMRQNGCPMFRRKKQCVQGHAVKPQPK